MGVDPVRSALTSEYVQKLITIKARQVIRRPGFTRSDQEDVAQELRRHVIRYACDFDPARGSVNTFIDRAVRSAVSNLVRDRQRLKRVANRPIRSLDRESVGRRGREPILLRETIEVADLRRRHGGGKAPSEEEERTLALDCSAVLAALPAPLREIAARLAEGSEASVARDLRISRRQVRKAVATIREHFAAAGFEKI